MKPPTWRVYHSKCRWPVHPSHIFGSSQHHLTAIANKSIQSSDIPYHKYIHISQHDYNKLRSRIDNMVLLTVPLKIVRRSFWNSKHRVNALWQITRLSLINTRCLVCKVTGIQITIQKSWSVQWISEVKHLAEINAFCQLANGCYCYEDPIRDDEL